MLSVRLVCPSLSFGMTPSFHHAIIRSSFLLRGFHWLDEDNMDFTECSPNIYCHITSLMFFGGILDFSVITHGHHSILTHAASRRLAFDFENSILMTIVLIIFIKYVMLSMRLQTKDT